MSTNHLRVLNKHASEYILHAFPIPSVMCLVLTTAIQKRNKKSNLVNKNLKFYLYTYTFLSKIENLKQPQACLTRFCPAFHDGPLGSNGINSKNWHNKVVLRFFLLIFPPCDFLSERRKNRIILIL